MLKRDITYEDFNGETVTETFYFNLTKTEIIQLQFGYEGGLEAAIRKIIESEDAKSLIEEFQKIVLAAYGVKSEDGKRFIKSEELRDEFKQTAAYDKLFMELATSEDAAAEFVKGVVPKDLTEELEKLAAPKVVEVPLPPPPRSA